MAIPFNLPLDDATLEHYRRIHQLLLDLTAILRGLIERNPQWIRLDASLPNVETNNNSSSNNNNNCGNVNNDTSNHVNAPQHHCARHHHHHHHGDPQRGAQNSPLQFGLPLSPPNSQPGSPSPFFTSPGSAFILPDVVSNAARTLNDLAPHQVLSSVSLLDIHNFRQRSTMAAANENGSANSPSIRKRKRNPKETMKRKSKPHDLDLCADERVKIPKTADENSASCSCGGDAVVDGMGQREPQQAFCCHDVPSFSNTVEKCACGLPMPAGFKMPFCLHVGEELRKMVDCFRNPRGISDELRDCKSSNYFTQFGRTIFTAALLVIGWRLLRHN